MGERLGGAVAWWPWAGGCDDGLVDQTAAERAQARREIIAEQVESIRARDGNQEAERVERRLFELWERALHGG